jgi:1-acyl-sn-glycerol-3-phosphate acyltransferase
LFCVKLLLEQRSRGPQIGLPDQPVGRRRNRRNAGAPDSAAWRFAAPRAIPARARCAITTRRSSVESLSPAITPDGPRGPPWKFKPGAILLAQLSQRPIIPMAYAASRAWKIKWDRFVIPKPFARVAIAVGEPVYVPRGLDAAALEALQLEMERRLRELFRAGQGSDRLSESPVARHQTPANTIA